MILHEFLIACFDIARQSVAVARARTLAAALAPRLPAGNFQPDRLFFARLAPNAGSAAETCRRWR